MTLPLAKKRFSFECFVPANEDFLFFNAMAPINCYYNYYSYYLTLFLECLNVISW